MTGFFQYDTAIVRHLGRSFTDALQLVVTSIDVAVAKRQHAHYTDLLKRILSGQVLEMAAEDDQPDGCFVEDTAIVLNALQLVVLLRPGAPSRRGEVAQVREAMRRLLGPHPSWAMVEMPDEVSIDGGDILITPKHIFVGQSKRTTTLATRYLAQLVSHASVQVVSLQVVEGLHLKSALSILAEDHLVVCRNRTGQSIIEQLHQLGLVSESGERAPGQYAITQVKDQPLSNVLRLRDHLVLQAGFDAEDTRRLEDLARTMSLQVHMLEMSEMIKADGALTCGSLLMRLRD